MSSEKANGCAICGYSENLLRCSRCKSIYYCSKEHQKKHWKKHKVTCQESEQTQEVSGGGASSRSKSLSTFCDKSDSRSGESSLTPPRTPLPLEGSSEAEILSTSIEKLSLSPTTLKFATQETLKKTPTNEMPITSENVVLPRRPNFKDYPESRVQPPYLHKTPSDDMVQVVIEDLNAYGLCVLDNFCGPQMGNDALRDVLNIYSQGVFQDGQLVAKSKNDAQSIRSDKIMWVDGKEVYCRNIGYVLNRIDNLIMKANKSPDNGKLGCYNINGRTKAMLAVYPGSGTHYVKHVDNPNHDGRCITAIYYLNMNWDVQKSGGLLRIFPESESTTVADIAPIFDRLLFFWSDRQNPHEVQPSYDTRYAITLWYFDATERALATKRFQLEQQLKELSLTRTPPNADQLRLMHQLHKEMMIHEQKRTREQEIRQRKHKEASLRRKQSSS